MKTIIEKEIAEHLKVTNLMTSLTNVIEIATEFCKDSLRNGGKILIFGNGGSAADAQHIAAELVGRYKIDRKGLSAIALTTDTSTLTSISNDYSFELIFERQAEALAKKGDVLIGISTSGRSVNVIKGLKIAPKIGCKAIGLSGYDGGEMNQICDINIVVPSKETPRIQEMHIVIGHIICHLIEQDLTA
jgi:D-sedoheptulose 7-phosphate isomerase